MNPPLFCPLCYPKQNLRFFFSKIPPFFLNASARRRRRHKYQTPCSPSRRQPPRSSPPRRRSSSTRYYYYRVYRSHRFLCSSTKSSFYRFQQKRDDQHSFFSLFGSKTRYDFSIRSREKHFGSSRRRRTRRRSPSWAALSGPLDVTSVARGSSHAFLVSSCRAAHKVLSTCSVHLPHDRRGIKRQWRQRHWYDGGENHEEGSNRVYITNRRAYYPGGDCPGSDLDPAMQRNDGMHGHASEQQCREALAVGIGKL